MRNPDDALDMIQDVFMAVFRNLASFVVTAHLKAGCLNCPLSLY
ncbi:hypothetical protein [Colwellia sp. BRX10-3]|nr:hypothetical protein [Colwellia sp. BRX10-3]